MTLSKVRLDIANPSARQAIFDCNDMHRNLMKALGTVGERIAPRAEEALLYRLSRGKPGYELLVMSRNMPDWQKLGPFGYAAVEIREISALRDKLVRGMTLRFSLMAAPAKKVASEGKNSRRVFLRSEEERRVWLERQGEKYGFALVGVREAALPNDVLGRKGEQEIRYRAVEFAGVLTITDAGLFWNGYTRGIGAGKAYGLGMLMIARA